MKRLLLFLFLNFFCLAQAQVTEGNENKIQNQSTNVHINSNANNNSTNVQLNGVMVLDSMKVQSKDASNLEEVTITSRKEKAVVSAEKEAAKAKQKQVVATKFVSTKAVSSSQRTQRTPTPAQQASMDDQVQELKELDSSSFEYNLYNYSSGNYNVERESSLKKAEKMQPLNKEVVKFNVANAVVKGDTLNAKKYLQQFTEQQQITTESILYTQDVLVSSDANTTLITHGLQDTYGALENQMNYAKGQQTDIISLDFMQSESYRNLLKDKGYFVPLSSEVNVGFLQNFVEMNPSKRIALSLTIPKEYFEPLKNHLYLSGLVFEYRNSAPDNTYVKLEDFWYNRFNKKVLDMNTAFANKYAANYMPTVLYLKEYYERNNNGLRLQEMNRAYESIGIKTGKIKKKN